MFFIFICIVVVVVLGFWLFKSGAYAALTFLATSAFLSFEGAKFIWAAPQFLKLASIN